MKELCNIGQKLWDDSSYENYDEARYKKYVDHIKSCIECKKGLDIDIVIDEKDLIPIDEDEIKMR